MACVNDNTNVNGGNGYLLIIILYILLTIILGSSLRY